MTREASGTSWQPEASGMEGVHALRGPWRLMAHGFVFGAYTDQGGPRGGRQAFSTDMMLAAAGRDWGRDRWAARAMLSLEALGGRSGYRHILQTGESADGVTHLIDRQHPHDFAMELATMYSHSIGAQGSLFLYAGWPGEPALGPPAFMHRPSAAALPTAPLGHHWMDATHISFGVLTGGYTWKGLKLDASAFNGHEPDADRWDLETPRLDSYAARVTFNPSPRWSAQVSAGHIQAPERLHPTIDVNRYTASLSWSGRLGAAPAFATAAWGRNVRSRQLPNCFLSAGCFDLNGAVPYGPSRVQDALLLEATIEPGPPHVAFFRAERVEKDGLYPGRDPFNPRVFPVGAVQLGYLYELPFRGRAGLRVGAALGVSFVPEFIAPDYGRRPISYWILTQLRLR